MASPNRATSADWHVARARALAVLPAAQQWAVARAWAIRVGNWDETEHPRDEHGRFADAGDGGGGGGGPAPSGGAIGGGSDKLLLVNERPNQEKLDKWNAQLDAQLKEAEIGSDLYSELTKMQSNLRLYTEASAADLEADRKGLNTVYGGPRDADETKLLANAFTTYNPETGVAQVELLGATDPDAKLKVLQQIIERWGKRADRIEFNAFQDDKQSIALAQQAGFRLINDPADYGVAQLIYGKEGQTEGEKARTERFAREHSQKILGASQAAARLLGYDPKLVEVSDEDYKFTIGAEPFTRSAAGLAYLDTGKIVMFPKHLGSTDAAVSTMAHEVAHQKYQKVLNAIAEERAKFNAEMIATPGLYDLAVNADGTLKDNDFKKIYEERYPIYTRFLKHDATRDKRIKSDGVTDYSKAYWEQAKPGTPNQVTLTAADHETIAEMAKLVTNTGKLPGSREWKAYYKDIEKSYKELTTKEKLKAAA